MEPREPTAREGICGLLPRRTWSASEHNALPRSVEIGQGASFSSGGQISRQPLQERHEQHQVAGMGRHGLYAEPGAAQAHAGQDDPESQASERLVCTLERSGNGDSGARAGRTTTASPPRWNMTVSLDMPLSGPRASVIATPSLRNEPAQATRPALSSPTCRRHGSCCLAGHRSQRATSSESRRRGCWAPRPDPFPTTSTSRPPRPPCSNGPRWSAGVWPRFPA